MRFDHWTVLRYAGNMKWLCRCDCGAEREVLGKNLREGRSTSCGNCKYAKTKRIDLEGKTFGEWYVDGYAGDKYWNCTCSCGRQRKVPGFALRTRGIQSCGHTNRLTDLIGQRFGKLIVLKYVGNRQYECQCDCGNKAYVTTNCLISGSTKQCGCIRQTVYTKEYILDKLAEYTSEFGKPYKSDLAAYLGISIEYMYMLLRTYDIDNSNFDTRFGSYIEKQVYDYIKSLAGDSINIKLHDRQILKDLNQELDFYIPEKKLAIEVDGTYWHSQKLKDPKYHQNKTLECMKSGVRLIHIFEYEWIQDESREKIKQLLRNALSSNIKTVYARKCYIKEIDTDIEKEFLNSYHLQGYASSSIKYGLYSQQDNELLSIMTFGASRFNNQYQYELIRYCNKPYIRVIGGAEKLFKRFIKDYNPEQIISYCNMSKFSGGVYSRLGFNKADKFITDPNYVWVSYNFSNDKTILTRYQTQVKKLKDQGLDIYGNTEYEIMQNRGYLKVYDSGNMRFVWTKE